jgi:hypothetical protein
MSLDTFTEGAAFEIVTEHGDQAFAHDAEGAVLAVRTLREDHRNGWSLKAPTVYVMHEDLCIKTVSPQENV